MSATQQLLFKWLLALGTLCIVVVILGIVVMERSAAENGGGEMVHSIGLLVGLMLIGYYAMVLLLGALLRRLGSARSGWYSLALLLILLMVPVILLLRILT